MQKAAQHNLMGSFETVVGEKGVHVAVVAIAGEVEDSDPAVNRTKIAGIFGELYEEEQGKWRKEVVVP